MYALLITKDPDDKAIYTLALTRAGVSVTTVTTLDKAIEHWRQQPMDLMVLALSMAEMPDPVEAIGRLRIEAKAPLVIVRDGLNEELHCQLLRAGADLVVAPSTGLKLLIAQLQVLLRRANMVPNFSLPTMTVGACRLDPSTRTVEVTDKAPIRLTHLEFRLIYTLMVNRGQVVSTDAIVESVWGYTGQGDRTLVRGLVNRLRAKIEADPRSPQIILTIPGIGYSLNPD